MTIIEKAAYLKGLAEGLNLGKDTAEAKLIGALIDIVGDLAKAQSETDEDLGSLEEEVYDLDDDECCCCDDDDCDCCDCCDDEFEITCPACGETIVFDGLTDPEEDIVCPNCHEKLIYEFDEEENN